MKQLEKLLRSNIYYGQPNQPNNKYKPWKKIFVFVEGIYSMEGTIVRLPELIALKKKYKFYIYIDEAHSIGAIGKHGRGVSDYYGCDPNDIDILVGTYSKSFAAGGGYIAGTKGLISYLRKHSYASKYASALSPAVAAQIIAIFKILMRKNGTENRVESLTRNTLYFRRRLAQIGVMTCGNEHSPIIPIVTCQFSKYAIFVRTLIKHNIATIGVSYPMIPLKEGRIRICLSSAHTKKQLDYALGIIEKVAEEFGLKYSRLPKDKNVIEYENIEVYNYRY